MSHASSKSRVPTLRDHIVLKNHCKGLSATLSATIAKFESEKADFESRFQARCRALEQEALAWKEGQMKANQEYVASMFASAEREVLAAREETRQAKNETEKAKEEVQRSKEETRRAKEDAIKSKEETRRAKEEDADNIDYIVDFLALDNERDRIMYLFPDINQYIGDREGARRYISRCMRVHILIKVHPDKFAGRGNPAMLKLAHTAMTAVHRVKVRVEAALGL